MGSRSHGISGRFRGASSWPADGADKFFTDVSGFAMQHREPDKKIPIPEKEVYDEKRL